MADYHSSAGKESLIICFLEPRHAAAPFKNSIFMIETSRLKIYLASDDEMQTFIDCQEDTVLRTAFGEMLEGSRRHPYEREWYAMWMIELKDGTHIGEISFKGLSEAMTTEIGYGISETWQGYGYATEAVKALLQWVDTATQVRQVEAETEDDNIASKRVLEKSGFLPTGNRGEEGPRYVRNKPLLS